MTTIHIFAICVTCYLCYYTCIFFFISKCTFYNLRAELFNRLVVGTNIHKQFQ